MNLNYFNKDIKQSDQNVQDKKINPLFATTDNTSAQDVELAYDNFFNKFKKKKINVEIPDDLIDDYLKISEKIYTKCTEKIEMKTQSGLTGLQVL